MESLNGTDESLHSEFQPQPLLWNDSLTPEQKQPATSLFTTDEQLTKEAAIIARWQLATTPVPIGAITNPQSLSVDLAEMAVSPFIPEAALLNSLFPQPIPQLQLITPPKSAPEIVAQSKDLALAQIPYRCRNEF